jgi:hypothetical protein
MTELRVYEIIINQDIAFGEKFCGTEGKEALSARAGTD